VTFAASGTDPVTAAANTATLEIAGSMNTGAFAFSTAGTVQVDSTYTATLNAAPTGTGLVHKTGAGVMKVASDLSASAALAGINVDAGTLYVQSGKAPNAPIQIANGAALQLAGVDESAESEVTSAITVQSGGSIVVDANVDVGSALGSTHTLDYDSSTGIYTDGVVNLPWPSGLTGYSTPSPGDWWGPAFLTDDVADQGLSYGGVSLNFEGPSMWHPGFAIYWKDTGEFESVHPTTSVSTGMDAALSGTVLFSSGSKLVLGAGSNYTRNITVGTAS
jgi:hypothetical protein